MKRQGRESGAKEARQWRLAGVLACGAVLTAGAIVAGPQTDDTSAEIEATRATFDRWVDLREQTSKEKAKLEEQKLFLQGRIDLVRDQIEDTRKQIEERRSAVADTSKKRGELQAQADELVAATSTLEGRIADLEERVLALVDRLPAPLVEQVRQYTQQFPKEGKESSASLSQRYTLAVAVLNAVDKFNTSVHVVSERRDLANGSSAEVTTMYLGISEGFYVNGAGDAAGRGVPSPEGFVWTPINDSAEAVANAIAVFNQSDPAAYTHLPVVLTAADAESNDEDGE